MPYLHTFSSSYIDLRVLVISDKSMLSISPLILLT
nr:MAG TPA: hypothetical protein [Caudoviricetes sp.]